MQFVLNITRFFIEFNRNCIGIGLALTNSLQWKIGTICRAKEEAAAYGLGVGRFGGLKYCTDIPREPLPY